jgi:hypothetical protein
MKDVPRQIVLKKQGSSIDRATLDDTLSNPTALTTSVELSVPRRCKRLGHVYVKSDNDIWVERSYRNARGRKIYYYCSVHTGRKQLLEPPTGAAVIVRETEHRDDQLRRHLPASVQLVVRERHTRDELMAIPTPIVKSASAKGWKELFTKLFSKESAT